MRICYPYGLEGVDNGVAVYGADAMVHIGRWNRTWGFKVFDRSGRLIHHDDANEPDTHAEDFLDAIRTRRLPNADIGIGHLSALHAHLANIVARTGRNLRFDAGTETVVNDPEANLYIQRRYRTHWATPRIL